MTALLIILAPLVALVAWAVVFDLRRRRRRGSGGHDIGSATGKARGDAEGRGGVQPGDPPAAG
jgi:hypothetical protein